MNTFLKNMNMVFRGGDKVGSILQKKTDEIVPVNGRFIIFGKSKENQIPCPH